MRDGKAPDGLAGWGTGVVRYLRALWSGTEPLHRLVISDMLIGATLINVVVLALALVLFGIEAPRWLSATVFFAAFPYNLFVVLCVWRTAARSRSWFVWPARLLSLAWIGVMLLI